MVENQRNVALFFAIAFLQGLCFYSPVATLYRQAAGLTVFQIGLIEAISMGAMLLLEVPWGYVADRIGHRRTLAFCAALFAVSKVVFWQAETFSGFLAERLILSVVIAGLSGCDSAYLFACVGEEEGQWAFGAWGAVQTAGLLVASACSSLFLGEAYRRAAWWTVLSYAAAALVAPFLTDPKGVPQPHEVAAPKPPMAAILRSSLSIAPFLVGVALLEETSHFLTVFLSQMVYLRAGIPIRWFGLISILLAMCALLGARSHRLTGRLGRLGGGGLLFAVSVGACLLMALFPSPVPAVAGILLLRVTQALFTPLSLSLQNTAAAPAARATQLSCNAIVMDLVSVLLTPALGRAADTGCVPTLLLGALAYIAGLLLFLSGGRQMLPATPERWPVEN